MTPSLTILTVGHSTHTMDKFVDLLRTHGVTAVADVRSSPFSRFNPHFSRKPLEASLRERDIKYVFLGRELGARPEDPASYENGRVVYSRLAGTPLYKQGLSRLQKGAERERVAIMCAEQDPVDCHRTVLVAQSLVSLAVDVAHILPDGRLERHSDSMVRLRTRFGLAEADLFHTIDELTERALALQEERIAHTGHSPDDEGGSRP